MAAVTTARLAALVAAATPLVAGVQIRLTFGAPAVVLPGTLPQHEDLFFTIPSSQGAQLSTAARTVWGPARVNRSGVATEGIAVRRGVGSNGTGGDWSFQEGLNFTHGQLFQHNDSCLHSLGAIYDVRGPDALHGTVPPTRAMHSPYSDLFCATPEGDIAYSRDFSRPVTIEGLPFSIIDITSGETGWAQLSPSASGAHHPRLIFTPYVHTSEHDLLHQPPSSFGCCLNWTCPCGRMQGSVCLCPPRQAVPCRFGSWGPGVPPPPGHSPTGLCRNFSVVALASDDGGYSWQFLSVVASHAQYPQFEEGPNENSLVALPNGDLLSIIRIEGGDGLPHTRHRPLLQARSSDQGCSWVSSVMRSDIRSARPQLLELSGGVLLLLAIRPSFLLWSSADYGHSWSDATNLAHAHNDALPDGRRATDSFCPEFCAWSHMYNSSGAIIEDTWLETGYSSLMRLGPDMAMTCYIREVEHSLPSQWQPPPDCRRNGPLFCMRITVSHGQAATAERAQPTPPLKSDDSARNLSATESVHTRPPLQPHPPARTCALQPGVTGFPCHPGGDKNISEQVCTKADCCWHSSATHSETTRPSSVPQCWKPNCGATTSQAFCESAGPKPNLDCRWCDNIHLPNMSSSCQPAKSPCPGMTDCSSCTFPAMCAAADTPGDCQWCNASRSCKSRLAQCGSSARKPIASHLTIMTYYTHANQPELEVMHDWVTVVSEQPSAASAVATFRNWSLPSLMGELPWNPPLKGALASADALLMYDNAQNRSKNELGYLQPQWKSALARWVRTTAL